VLTLVLFAAVVAGMAPDDPFPALYEFTTQTRAGHHLAFDH